MKFNLTKWLAFLVAILFILSMVVSYESTVIPEWKVKIVDKNSNPIARVEVIQEWAHKSLESGPVHQETIFSDKNGEVTFPERTVRASLLRRGIGILADTIGIINIHATTGKFAIVHTQKDLPLLLYRDSRELEHVLVVEKW